VVEDLGFGYAMTNGLPLQHAIHQQVFVGFIHLDGRGAAALPGGTGQVALFVEALSDAFSHRTRCLISRFLGTTLRSRLPVTPQFTRPLGFARQNKASSPSVLLRSTGIASPGTARFLFVQSAIVRP
jgi:hypothetical protein